MKGKCFIEPLFHAVVEGRKTMMREVIKPQPKLALGYVPNVEIVLGNPDYAYKGGFRDAHGRIFVPRYIIGEKVYLKEPYYKNYPWTGNDTASYKYERDMSIYHDGLAYMGEIEWDNPITMPSKYARYYIEITSARVEPLQRISGEDCEKEGICKVDNLSTYKSFALPETPNYAEFKTPQKAFAALFDKIKRGTWDSNPYVWVYEFKLVK